MKNNQRPLFVAIVGGSGAGKTWLAEKLQSVLGRTAARLSLDDFYHDRSHVPIHRRGAINFDNPRAIDWLAVENVFRTLRAQQTAQLPCYDFKTHCRLRRNKRLVPKPIILVDGLWLLRRPSVRRLFDLRIFINCPMPIRLRRRMARDILSRGRTRTSIRQQFRQDVEPMHARFVIPQKRWADVVLSSNFGDHEMRQLAERLKALGRRSVKNEKAGMNASKEKQKALKRSASTP